MSTLSETFLECARAASSGSLPDCKPLGFTIVDWLTTIVSIGSIFAGLCWALTQIPRLFGTNDDKKIRSFKSLRDSIRPLMDENYRIFSDFGPNSGANAKGTVRFDLSVWKRARRKIDKNNKKISELIQDNQHLIPANYQKIFGEWMSHIDAFSAHLEDETVDYRNHQFPGSVVKIIRSG